MTTRCSDAHALAAVAFGLAWLVFFGVGCAPANYGNMDFPEGVQQHVVRGGDLQYRPCPPELPSGCEIAILEGHPKATGTLFTVRFRLERGLYMRPHLHPSDERVTVLDGKVSVAFGYTATHEDAKQFGPGDYYVNERASIHQVWIDEPSILQITGIGPWEARFVGTASPNSGP